MTVLSGDLGTQGDDADNAYHVVTGAPNTTLDGFTITLGHANGATTENTHGGGMYNHNCTPTVANCTYVYASSGTSLSISRCTFSKNSAGSGGAIVFHYLGSSSTSVTGSIFWGNRASSAVSSIAGSAVASVTYCDTEEACTVESGCTKNTTGDISADPLFVDETNEDLRLQAVSPCVDRAQRASYSAKDKVGNPVVDIAGVGNDGTNYADMGAYEYQS